MSASSRQIHKETFTTVFTGLLINYPLNLTGLYICIDVLGMTSALQIGTTITAFMTFVAYTRVYIIRRYFYKHQRTSSR
jgi:cytochrome b subunit of formate dehydrogenase